VPHAERRGVADVELGPRLILLATNEAGYRSLARLLSRSNLAASKGVTRLTHELLAEHCAERPGSLLVVSPLIESEISRRLATGDRAGARAAAAGQGRGRRRVLMHQGEGLRQGRGDRPGPALDRHGPAQIGRIEHIPAAARGGCYSTRSELPRTLDAT
jgi:hypothetical protein